MFKILLPAAGLWIALWFVLASTLPLLPIDETRYLTVAWEMRLSHHWLLPTLNGEAYSHKPPLLFWLINLMWMVTGPQLWAARLVPGIVSLCVFFLTHALALRLYPDRPRIAVLAPLLLIVCPAFMAYGDMIMFDLLLSCFVLLALEHVWRATRNIAVGGAAHITRREWLFFGLFTGFGVLAKGPAVLLYVLFPALLAPFFLKGTLPSKKRWYSGLLLGIGVAALVGLAWAIPAAIQGGPEFAKMLFWKQSAGRMVESFAHKRPIWFYLPFIPGFCLPLLLWQPFWRALRYGRDAVREPQALFLACAVGGPFIAFSLISGKQVHYMMPLLPSAAILLAALFDRASQLWPGAKDGETISRPADCIGIVGLFALLTAAAFAFPHLPSLRHSQNLLIKTTLENLHLAWFGAAGAAAILIAVLLRRRTGTQLVSLLAGLIFFVTAVVYQGAQTVLPYFDLRPISAALQPYKAGPTAYAAKYAGEVGYLAQLQHPFDLIDQKDMPTWFAQHPDGVVLIRHNDEPVLDWGAFVVSSYQYKADQRFTLLKFKE